MCCDGIVEYSFHHPRSSRGYGKIKLKGGIKQRPCIDSDQPEPSKLRSSIPLSVVQFSYYVKEVQTTADGCPLKENQLTVTDC